jgi:Lrp/AsnC family leucine-responsive transcriptional regulator
MILSMPPVRPVDDVDLLLLQLMQSNARITQAELAKQVGLAPSAVLERVRKLEARGAIRGYHAMVDPRLLERPLLAFVAVRADERQAGGAMPVASALSAMADVLEVHHVAGDDCYLLKVRARDAEHLGQLLRTQIAVLPDVRSTRTTIVLESIKETPVIGPGRAPILDEGVAHE